jgi:hypothetical protein
VPRERPTGDPSAGYAARAAQAYATMEARFHTSSGLYRGEGSLRGRRSVAHLWPFARAFVATLDLAGIDEGPLSGFDADAAIAERLKALEFYWDPAGDPPAYSSDVVGTRFGGDRYYDDNAWVGLALVQLERMRPGAGSLSRAADLFRFAVGGWDRRPDVPSPGGVFWVEQGRGAGKRNHDRNTVSNAPNSQLGMHLAELTGVSAAASESIGTDQMYEWVNATLDAGAGRDSAGSGLYWDKLRGDGTIDRALWSYNQGSMAGANVLLHRRAGTAQTQYLTRAEAIARKALARYRDGYEKQPPAFNAIFFRNLLLVHAATDDVALGAGILEAMRGYTDWLWSNRRERSRRFRLAGASLLDQSAIVQLLALLAWDPADYRKLA